MIDNIKSMLENGDYEKSQSKSSVKLSDRMSASTESVSKDEFKTQIKTFDGKNASTETDLYKIDEQNQRKLEAFREKNSQGHASDSTLQDVLYKAKHDSTDYRQNNSSIQQENGSSEDLKTHIKLVGGSHHSI